MGFAANVAALFRARAADVSLPEPPLPPGYAIDVATPIEEESAPVLPPLAGDAVDGIGCVFGMLYADPQGRVTWRRITVRGLARDGDDIAFRAYCHERHAPLQFRASGIQELINLKTGSAIEGPAAYFARFLSDDPTFQAIRHCGPALQLLTFMARCDGHEAPGERDIIVAYIRESCTDSRLEEATLRRHLTTLHPDEEAFQVALAALEAMTVNDAARIVDYAIRIVESDGHTDPREARWLEDIRSVLR